MSFSRGDGWGREEPYRRRSPIRHRRRSRSPGGDRFPPRRDGYGREDFRRRTPPGDVAGIDRYVPGQEPPPPPFNTLPHPLTLDYQLPFSGYADWWRRDQDVKEGKQNGGRRPHRGQESPEERERQREQLQTDFSAYKQQFQHQISKQVAMENKDQDWFREKYDAEVRDPFRRRLAEFRRSNWTTWQTDLAEGLFDEFSLEGVYKGEDGNAVAAEKEEGETNEVHGTGDLVPADKSDIRDDAAHQPALLIKTIAPFVGREHLEAFCTTHLGDGPGGFRWLSLSDPMPMKKNHRIGWVLLDNRVAEAEVVKAERGDGREEEDEGEEHNALEVEPEAQSAAANALEAIDGKAVEVDGKGSFKCHFGIHRNSPARKKALWDLFSAPERIERDLELATKIIVKLDTELGEDVNACSKIDERVEDLRSKGLLKPAESSKPQRAEENGDNGDEDGELDEEIEETDDEELLTKKKRLDLMVEYLRRVHNFCLYCVVECDSVYELNRKCPGGHLRRPRASLSSAAKTVARATAYGEPFPLSKEKENGEPAPEEDAQKEKFNKHNKTHIQLHRAYSWAKTYEDKLYRILDPASVDIRKLGGQPIEEELDKELAAFVKQEDESRYRCKVPECVKLFKGETFWRKHVEKRHAEWYEGLRKMIELVNNYVLDPAHIPPITFREGGQGHYPPNNMMPAPPRGFGQNVMPYPGMLPPPGFPSTFGHYPVSMPSPVPGYPNPPYGMPAPGFAGPVRRQPGGRYNARGPYDRPGGRGPRGGAANGGPRGERFADAPAGGAGASVGPREAVQGRSLKSYEDLDAVGAGGNGELDY